TPTRGRTTSTSHKKRASTTRSAQRGCRGALPKRALNMDPVKAFAFLLLAVHGALAVWALVGFAEWFSASVPWPRVSNPLFPRDILFMQWALTLAAAAVFLGGYALGWAHTPTAMACVYAAMAALCAVQTFRYMESDTRFL